jgi:hypothetical protein
MIHTIHEPGFPIPTPHGGIGMIHTGMTIIDVPAITAMIHHVVAAAMKMIIDMIVITEETEGTMMTVAITITTLQEMVHRREAATMVRHLRVARR